MEQVCKAALEHVTSFKPVPNFIMVDSLLWNFFFSISKRYNMPLNLIPLSRNIPAISSNEIVGLLGRPREIEQFDHSLPPGTKVFIITIPLESFLVKTNILKLPLSLVGFQSLCFPFLPTANTLLMPIGNFSSLFINEPVFESKAIKSCLVCLNELFGGISRTIGIGEYSSNLVRGYLDAISSISKLASDSPNILLSLDRDLDLITPISTCGTYLNLLEEFIPFDSINFSVPAEYLSQVLKIHGSFFSPSDDLFPQISIMTPSAAISYLKGLSIRPGERGTLKEGHLKILQHLIQLNETKYLLQLFLELENDTKKAEEKGRILAIDDDAQLGYRFLSFLVALGKKSQAKSIARLIGRRFGIPMFSKWTRIEQMLPKRMNEVSPDGIKEIISSYPIQPVLPTLLAKSMMEMPINDVKNYYCSTAVSLPKKPLRWFVVVIGGITNNEIAMMKAVAAKCRPNDEMILVPTSIYSPSNFMREILGYLV